MIEQFKEAAPASVALAKGTLVEPREQFRDRLVELGQAEELALPQRRQDPPFNDLYSGFRFGFVTRFCGPGRHYGNAVMRGHLLVGTIDAGFIPARFRDPGLEIVRGDDFGHTAQELKGAHMGTDPVGQTLSQARLGVGVVAGAQDRDEDRRFPDFAVFRVVNGDGGAGVVHE